MTETEDKIDPQLLAMARERFGRRGCVCANCEKLRKRAARLAQHWADSRKRKVRNEMLATERKINTPCSVCGGASKQVPCAQCGVCRNCHPGQLHAWTEDA